MGSRLRPDHIGRLATCLALAACGSAPARPAPAASCAADRDVVIASQADVARLVGCTTVHRLTIRTGAAINTAPLRALTAITGDLVIGPTVGVEDITLGELRRIDGALRVVGNGLMQGLFLRKLERAGSIAIDGNAALTTIGLPALTTAAALRVTDNASLELLDLAALTAIDGELVVTGAARLTLLDAPQLHTAVRVELDAPRLPAETIVALHALSPPP